MLYLFLGNAIVGLFILLGIPLEDELSGGQYLFMIAFSVLLDFLPVLAYLVGRQLSKTAKVHWETLLFIGVLIGLLTQVLVPNLGLGISDDTSLWYLPMIFFFAAAFVPNSVEIWRSKSA